MVRADKATAVAELTEAFRSSSAAVLTEYRGLTVAELKALRRALAGNATYAVVKNTLTKIAAREAGIDVFEPMLEGPSAIAFVSGDAVEVAKGLRAFGREHPHLIVKGGILDGKALSADEIRRLADLESREVLLAKLAGGLLAPAQQLANVLGAQMGQLARLLGALEAKLASEPQPATGGDGASAVEPTPGESEPAPEAAAAEATPAEDAPADLEAAPASEADTDAAPAPEADTDAAPAPEAADAPAPTTDSATDDNPTGDATDAPAEN
jgi:large subunit ribosomal protein L10